MKNFLKGVVSGTVIATMLLSNLVYATEFVVNDSGVKLEGNLLPAWENSVITVTVVEKNGNWLDEASWILGDEIADKVVYYNELTAGKNGKYNTSFVPKRNGKYDVFLGNDEIDEPERLEIIYIKKSDNVLAAAELISGNGDNSELLKNKRLELGLFNCVYDEAFINSDGSYNDEALDSVGNFIKGELDDVTVDDTEKIIKIIEKSTMIYLLNNEKISDISLHKDSLYLSDLGIEKYYSGSIGEGVAKQLSGRDFANIDEYEDNLKKAIIVESINLSDSYGTVNSILTDFSASLGIKNNIGSLTTEVMKKAPFADFKKLTECIKKYESTASSNGNAFGGGGGGATGPSAPTSPFGSGFAKGDANAIGVEERKYFNDIDDVLWAEEAINALYLDGIIDGKADGVFAPYDMVTREEFVKMLTLAFKINLVDDEFPFSDVTTKDWCYPYVKSAYLAGIVNGVSETAFGKEQNITRQDACVMLANAVKVSDYVLPVNSDILFVDEGEIADYAKEAVKDIAAAGIINGDENKFFLPNDFANRAEAAKMIYYTMNCIGKN